MRKSIFICGPFSSQLSLFTLQTSDKWRNAPFEDGFPVSTPAMFQNAQGRAEVIKLSTHFAGYQTSNKFFGGQLGDIPLVKMHEVKFGLTV